MILRTVINLGLYLAFLLTTLKTHTLQFQPICPPVMTGSYIVVQEITRSTHFWPKLKLLHPIHLISQALPQFIDSNTLFLSQLIPYKLENNQT